MKANSLIRCVLILLALGGMVPPAAEAVDLLPYFLPNTPNRLIYMQSGEVFHTKRATIYGRQGFYLVKSQDGRGYEEFWYDDNYIYHLRDTTWATGPNQNVKCSTGEDAFFTILEGSFGTDRNNPCATWNAHKSQEKARWVQRNMNVGGTFTTHQTVIGISKSGCGCCNTDYDGYGGLRVIQFVSLDFRSYPGWSGQVARFVVTDGPGKGDNFYYGQDVGLLGFEIRPVDNPIHGTPSWSNFPTSITTGTLTESQYCPRPGAPLTIPNPSTGINADLWITQCFGAGRQRVWRVTSDRRLADYLYDENQYDACGTPDPTFGGYPLKFRTAFPVANIWITWCAGSGHTEYVWKTNGTQYAPFQYPQYNSLCP